MCLNFNSNSEYFQLHSSEGVCVLSSSLLVVSNINTMKLEKCKPLTFLVVIFNLDCMHRDLTCSNFNSRSYVTEAGKKPEWPETKTPAHPCSPPHHWGNTLHFSQSQKCTKIYSYYIQQIKSKNQLHCLRMWKIIFHSKKPPNNRILQHINNFTQIAIPHFACWYTFVLQTQATHRIYSY